MFKCNAILLNLITLMLSGWILFETSTPLLAQNQRDILHERYTFPSEKTTLYDALGIIGQKCGCLFVYDSKIIPNDKNVCLKADNQTLPSIISDMANDSTLRFKVISNHILIYRAAPDRDIAPIQSIKDTLPQSIVIQGRIFDKSRNTPIPFATIAVMGSTYGTVSNDEGAFRIKINSNDSNGELAVSCLGYKQYRLPVALAGNGNMDIFLIPDVISLQEVVIRRQIPDEIIKEAVKKRDINNAHTPVYLTGYYRESVKRNEKYMSFAEGVFKVYKPPFDQNPSACQAKELKSRKMTDIEITDTLVMRIRGGIATCLMLDVVSILPDFLKSTEMNNYNYRMEDIVTFESQTAYSIYFEQKPKIQDARYAGNIYIGTDSLTILGADFEINPKYIDNASDYLVSKSSRGFIVKPERFCYSVVYKPINNKYYLGHSRCLIKLKARKKGHFFSNTYTGHLELAICDMDNNTVERFKRHEIIKPQVIYQTAPFVYDNLFWGDYNTIAPEEKLSDALKRMKMKLDTIE